MKKVLIITYYWPPCGGIGVLRNLKFVKYLREFGWEPVVFIPKNAQYPYYDANNLKDIPEGLEIITQEIFEPYNLFKKLTGKNKDTPLNNPVAVRDTELKLKDKLGIWLRGNFFIPDARMFWIKPSVKRLIKYIRENKIDAIYSDGPPHTNTRIATLVKKATNIPWLADFQDPWSQVDYLERFMLTPLAWEKHRKMEQQAFKYADKITTASPRSALQLQEIGARDVSSIYYGYDESDFHNLETNPKSKFRITHAGLLGIDRAPDGLYKALNKLLVNHASLGSHLEISLAGQADYEVLEQFKEFGLWQFVSELGTISRREVLQLITDSSVLLLCINKASNADGRIPAKIFEYVRTGNHVLALGPIESDISDILRDINAQPTFDYNDETGIYQFLEYAYLDFLKNKTTLSLNSNVSKYSNYQTTKQLAYFLNKITAES